MDVDLKMYLNELKVPQNDPGNKTRCVSYRCSDDQR